MTDSVLDTIIHAFLLISSLYIYIIKEYIGSHYRFEIDGVINENLPRTPAFQTMYVYLRPLTMCLETVK